MDSLNKKFEYTPKSYLEKQKHFSKEQEEFLESEVEEMKKGALLEDDYVHLYSNDFVKSCKDKIKEYKKSNVLDHKTREVRGELEENPTITKERRKVSEYLEALFYKKLGGKQGWIPDAIVWKTSEYDDYVNGIDFMVEAEDKEITLATDLTFSYAKNLTHKLKKIKQNINIGRIPSVTFYERSKDTVNKPIPHVIIAVEYERIIMALKLWADGQGETLENHPLKAKTMLELEAQLEAFAIYAKSLNKRNIASAYNDMLSKIQSLIMNHEDTIKKYQRQIDDDLSYKAIIGFCDDLKKEAENIEKKRRELE